MVLFGVWVLLQLDSSGGGEQGEWRVVSNNLNRDKLNYFYRLLAGLSVVNFGVYLICRSWYKYKKVNIDQAVRVVMDPDGKINSASS